MDQNFNGESSRMIDRTRVLDVKPLRCLAPVFPSPPPGSSASGTQGSSPFVCIPPNGPFPLGVAPLYPFLLNESERPAHYTPAGTQGSFGFGNTIPSPVPLNVFRTPTTQVGSQYANGSTSRTRKTNKTRASVVDEDGFSDSLNESDQYGMDGEDGNTSGKRKARKKTKSRNPQMSGSPSNVDEEGILNSICTSLKLLDMDMFKKATGDTDLVERILLAYDLIRRKFAQHDDNKESTPGAARRPDLKVANLLMVKGIRTNHTKRIGHVPGVEIGDIFFFRMELCIVGLHAPSMAGIDYMTVKVSVDEEPIAVSIVSSGGYEDEGDDGEVLIYTGQGGVQRRDGQMFDQKLERGNLALEKSVHRGNEVRVIRGVKDLANPTGKIYVYDGVYKIQESWTEKNKLGCSIFKYKLVRIPGQPEAFTLWKSIQQWKDGVTSRGGVILPDLTSGAETLPVSLVNNVDEEKGPAYFTYIPTLRYSKPFTSNEGSLSCHCVGGCQAKDVNCVCIQKNEGLLPYSGLGVLYRYNTLVHECGSGCSCQASCRNRITQSGLKVRLEVFKTNNRGWGLRSWDPIRGGGFICEYAGEVIDGNDNDENDYIFDATRVYESLEGEGDHDKSPFPLVISAKNGGNVARFMNHSCSPNVYWQPILRGNGDEAYLHVAFFAIRHIPPMQELTFDYGMLQPDKAHYSKRKSCACGTSKCMGYFY